MKTTLTPTVAVSLEELEKQIIEKYGPGTTCCEIPNDEYGLGGMIGQYVSRCGHHHGWGTCANLGYAGAPIRDFLRAVR